MPPKIASIIFISIIVYLFWRDRGNYEGFSKAIWLPFAWLFASRSSKILGWMGFSFMSGSEEMIEGNPFYRMVYTVLILWGIYVLSKSKVNWKSWFSKNIWVWLYFLFGAISITWSDYPFVSLKRLIKASGTIIIALIFIIEVKPYAAMWVVMKRLSFILIPLSVLFIKYYPRFGVAYHVTGARLYGGVTGGKNPLGALCMMLGIFYAWNLLYGRKDKEEKSHQLHYSIYLIIFPMIGWLMYMANSATSFACLIAAVCILCVGRLSFFVQSPHKIIPYGILSAVIFGFAQILFNIKDTIIEMLGRRPDLTTRVPMWVDLLNMVRNPIIGYGYESFWLGERLVAVQARWGDLIQAHNGYIEMYLNMGAIGILFILGWIISGLKNVKTYIDNDYSGGILRFCFIVVVVLYNYTEAIFYGRSTLWMLFFIAIMTIQKKVYLHKYPSEVSKKE